jgi:predicted AAA+ superfamily ATPase
MLDFPKDLVYAVHEAKMINRPVYLEDLKRHRISPDLIKIVTGIRRCGKSTLFKLYQEYLHKNKIAKAQILTINLEDIAHEALLDGKALHAYVEKKILPDKMNYVFLDEIQLVSNYGKIINSLRLRKNIDLYVTGSNSSLLAHNLPSILGGRFINIKMLPLSFKEYAGAIPKSENLDGLFDNYLKYSSFPEVLHYTSGSFDKQAVHNYLDNIYNSILVRDVMQHEGVKDLPQLTRIIKYLFGNIGNETSINNMVGVINNDFNLKPNDKKLYAPVVEKYIHAILDSFVFYQADRYYIKGKERLRTNSKYYAVDAGLRYYLLGQTNDDSGHVLENTVYLELKRRGYEVFVGKVDAQEVDFVAARPGGIIEYYQVSETMRSPEVRRRELEPLQKIKDSYPKYILTRDWTDANTKGIQHINVLKWLLGED